MAAVVHLDTHVLVWLEAGDAKRLRPARLWLERHDLVASPMAILELDYLYEVGRLRRGGASIVESLVAKVGLSVSSTPFYDVVRKAASLSFTRDPFDRLLVANAQAEGVRLVTQDRTLLKAVKGTCVWAR